MRITRYSPALLCVAAMLTAGCGSVSPSSSIALKGAPVTLPVQVVRITPQSTAQVYLEGLTKLNGNAICSVVDSSLRRSIVNFAVTNHVAIPGVPCSTTMRRFAVAITAPKERGGKVPVPKFRVQTTGSGATVRYIGTSSHKEHSMTLVKAPGGWLIDKINGNG